MCRSQLLSESIAQLLNISSRIWITLSDCPSIYGWNVVLKFSRVPKASCNYGFSQIIIIGYTNPILIIQGPIFLYFELCFLTVSNLIHYGRNFLIVFGASSTRFNKFGLAINSATIVPSSNNDRWAFNARSVCTVFLLKASATTLAFSRVIINHAVIIFYQLHPSSLSQVKLSLRGKILKTLMIGVNVTLFSIQVMSPNF